MNVKKVIFLALPFNPAAQDKFQAQYEFIQSKVNAVKSLNIVRIQALNCGSLDNLLECSEIATRIDLLGEQVAGRHLSLLEEIADGKRDQLAQVLLPPKGTALPIAKYLERLQWESATFPHSSPVKALLLLMQKQLNDADANTKRRLQEYGELKNRVHSITKKADGNLTVRPIADKVRDFYRRARGHGGDDSPVQSHYLTTLFVVVPRQDRSQWEESYATLDGREAGEAYVVPGSSELIIEDKEGGDLLLFGVVVFKAPGAVDAFKSGARVRKWTVREYEPDSEPSPHVVAALKSELETKRGKLETWLKGAFSEVYISWAHVKMTRLYVEAILRYGLPPAFVPLCVFIEQSKQEQSLRKELGSLYSHLQSKFGADEAPEAGALELQYPYVSLTMDALGDKK
eukprot:TRINITY_DN2005_c0_g1_i1.p1 TRINITY_DN2005_c0_g1~~TRINITY_DN2005_c0_g1_i1.p1  ORF type:complete len:401 (-),score=97.58 TRINITY_DN2005_c0_g1_i1:1107-2309(-)